MRTGTNRPPYTPQILFTRVLRLKKLSHPNISVFYGVAIEISPFALVYGWEENGNILQYTRLHPNTPRLALVLSLPSAHDTTP